MDLDRAATIDGVVVVMLVLYGFAVAGTAPLRAVSVWLIGGLLALSRVVEPFGRFVEENRVTFLLLLLAILAAGFLFS